MSSTAMHHDLQVISTAEHVPLACRETVKVLAGWGMSEQVVDTACLIISELVTNVVQHAAVLSPTATVSFAVQDGAELVLAVAVGEVVPNELLIPDIAVCDAGAVCRGRDPAQLAAGSRALPRLYLGALQAGTHIDRLVQGSGAATVDQPLPIAVTPCRFAARPAQ
ncbi:ATP-binding protein [Streptomyces yunnanensis]|uniref:Histidine kinase/HSP90-like ATPase domain-containing protein n=1 Tax=Streptomyces yunnanensis TaxID=156453 RepID=A0A9X8R094_9ACTN|nr:ATP-binding protein [Streptomyces yunnanensis]SHN31687.1 hypothetical protein SAMN05216268_13448 [Streptomyces yunnanensis]